jgi:triosephosphate isomerase
MTRRPLISANWKMNLNHYEAIQAVQKLHYLVARDTFDDVDVSIHPPFTDLRSVQTVGESDEMHVLLGAQHCHYESPGAYPGEISPAFLAKLNTQYVIAGHSARRELFGETDDLVNRKVRAIIEHDMTPILCVGETLAEREAGDTQTKVVGQLAAGLAGVADEQVAGLVIAYEPIWAIGTGQTATAADAQDVCATIRREIRARGGGDTAAAVRIQYGGSVKPANAAELLTQPDIDGALVGGASLVPEDFAAIVQFRAL